MISNTLLGIALDQLFVPPPGIHPSEVLLPAFTVDSNLPSGNRVEQLKLLMTSSGIRPIKDLSGLSSTSLFSLIESGTEAQSWVTSDILTLLYSSWQFVDEKYLAENGMVSEARHASMALLGHQDIPLAPPEMVSYHRMHAFLWKRAITWLSSRKDFTYIEETNMLITKVLVGAKLNEGDHLIVSRWPGVPSKTLASLLLRAHHILQDSAKLLNKLTDLTLRGLSQSILSIVDSNSAAPSTKLGELLRFYYGICILADQLSTPGPKGYARLNLRTKMVEKIDFRIESQLHMSNLANEWKSGYTGVLRLNNH